MSNKMIRLALIVSMAFLIGACATVPIDPAAKGKIGDPVAPSSANSVGAYGYRGWAGGVIAPTDLTLATPLSVDLSKTPAPKGKIGDPVAPSSANSVGAYSYRGWAGGVIAPTDLTMAAPIGVDNSKTPALRGVIGDPVAPSGKTTLPGELTLTYPMK